MKNNLLTIESLKAKMDLFVGILLMPLYESGRVLDAFTNFAASFCGVQEFDEGVHPLVRVII
jgi:hypothetical protein